MTPLTTYIVPAKLVGLFTIEETIEVYKVADVEAALTDCREILDDIASGDFEYTQGFRARANILLDRLKGTPA